MAPPAPEPPKAVVPPPDRPGSLDFDLLGDGKPRLTLAPSSQALAIEQKVKLRRGLLQAHQAAGFATLGLMAVTLVLGQLDYIDNYTSGAFTGRYDRPHLGLGIASTTLFATTGVLALVAPNPYPKPLRFDSGLVHKASMILATAGMLTQIILGPVTVARDGKLDQPRLALVHLSTGYATFGFMAVGTFAYVF